MSATGCQALPTGLASGRALTARALPTVILPSLQNLSEVGTDAEATSQGRITDASDTEQRSSSAAPSQQKPAAAEVRGWSTGRRYWRTVVVVVVTGVFWW